MKKYYVLFLWVSLLAKLSGATAQALGQNWYFGNYAGLRFGGASGPVALTDGALLSYEGCAALSDYNGQLRAYTNGEIIWDKNHQPMPNGASGLGGFASASQAAVLVPLPNSAATAYLFCVDEIEHDLVGGFRYSVVDFALRGGLGDVTATKGVQLPTPTPGGKVTEKLCAVRHANGRDYWIVVHGWQSNAFYSFLLTPSGLNTTPVVTNIGSVHQGGQSFFNDGNAIGCMKASPDGRWLALAKRDSNTELYTFNNGTGQLSNYQSLGSYDYNYGVEFSADNSRLYVSQVFGYILQFNLQAGSGPAIASSVRTVTSSADRYGSLQRGPDNRIYSANYNTNYLDVITNPNALGTACGYTSQAILLAGRLDQNGLPNLPNQFAGGDVAASFTPLTACVGTAVNFGGSPTAIAGSTPTWNFGDPASGSANTATGLTPSHTFSQAGTYQVTLTVPYSIFFAPATTTQTVTVLPRPTVRLGRDTTLCGTQVVLAPNAQPTGSTYRWQDGSTGATYVAKANGRYRVTITSPGGCSSTDSVRVTLNTSPTVRLPADTVVCASTFALQPRGSWPTGSTYLWQDGRTTLTYPVQNSGSFAVWVTTPQGCRSMAVSRITLGAPPALTLGADTLVCATANFVLRPSPQPAGTTYRWQDGSTAPTFLAHGPGTYSVQVRSAAGCTASATRVAGPANCLVVIPNIITPNGDAQNEFFELKGLTATDWHLSVFDRWGRQLYDQPTYDNRWNAQGLSAGIYYYLLRNTAGQQYRGWVEVLRN